MANTINMYITYVVSLTIISLFSISQSEPTANGFTTDLIHRDSPQSPSYDPTLSHSQRLINAIRRSSHRIQRFDPKGSSPRPDLVNSNGEYLMKYSVGTPPVPSLGIADTGSDIIWTQCKPCIQCFNQSLPIFNPKTSSTYRTVRCNTPSCQSFLEYSSCKASRSNSCLYSESYADGSFTQGNLARDTVTLASAGGKSVISVPKVVIGCGFENAGKFSGVESGIVGLGGGKASLVRQLGPLANGKFSYCLVALSEKSNSSSKLSFGTNAVVSGRGVGSTPILRQKVDTFYYATLLGISVGNRKLEMYDASSSSGNRKGNIVVDSGTTLTYLPSDLYAKLKSALQNGIKLKQIKDPEGILDLCFYTRRQNVRIPDITVHFEGADLKWKQDNVLVRMSDVTVCLAALPAQGPAIFGNLAQINFLVGYDLQKWTLSFKPMDCAKL
ncbi:hypothetical protein CASFOL_031926 [Castilleja foliolosa]|uniref:Peptidase A1 domain-containing protein n=1 Tax=Castilleja foliolosa TaxID=1961234 RepID=A0ABD3C0M2_9LAMI